jgi:V/A-type H+-transporting ATPase subunit C
LSKVKDRDYLALTAMLRAREARMLDRDRMERMLASGSFGDAAKLLTDLGYEDMSSMNAGELDEVLSTRRLAIYEEIGRMCPEKELVDVFRLKYDYHNAKVLVKAGALGSGSTDLLSNMGRVVAEKLETAVAEARFSEVPAVLAKGIQEAQVILAKTGNSQAAEFILDRAYHKELELLANQQDSAFLKGYAKILIDAANLGAAVRTVRMKKGAEFLMTALFEGGNASPSSVADAALNGDALTALFTATPLAGAAALGVDAMKGGSMTKFELACDDAVTAYLGRAKMISFGPEAVVAYLARLEGEITAIRMILTGLHAGINPAVIRERLRDLNG